MAALTVTLPEILIAYNPEFRSVTISSGDALKTYRDIPVSQSVVSLIKREVRALVEQQMKDATWQSP